MKLSQTAADLMAEVIVAGDIEDLVVNLPQHSMLPSEAAYTALVKTLPGREAGLPDRGTSSHDFPVSRRKGGSGVS
jgi:hypothetical protein